VRKTTANFLHKLIRENNPIILFTLRNIYGEKTREMTEKQIFRIVKKLWTNNTLNRKEITKCHK